MLGVVFRLLFSMGIIVWYSMNVWTMITDYFNNKFKESFFNETEEYEYEDL